MRWRQLLQWWLRRRSHSLLQRWRKWSRPWSNVAMRWPRGRKRWQTRPTSNAGPPCGRKRWPTTPTNNVKRPQEKALADKANKQCRATVRDKALVNEANEQRCHELAKHATTLATKALAKDAYNKDNDDVAWQFKPYAAPLFACVDAVMAKIRAMDDSFGNWAAFSDEILAKEDDKASAPTMLPSAPPTAVLPTPHCSTTYKDAVLSTMGGSLCAKSLVVAPLSRPSIKIDCQPLTACCRS
jgi:hypothetical protein